jgi:EAL domain-containing protein (putative c-di-GMP-specific phosphodiesterase class I)
LRAEADVRAALDTGQFTVYYQPIVDVASGEVTSVEALVRWDHPERGVVTPFEFLAVAERTGAIRELGSFVLRTACAQLRQWRADWPDLCVAVNLSQAELLDEDLVPRVREALDSAGLPPAALHLEVTETVLAADHLVLAAVESLVDLGVSLSIDDFGTGHSSLSRIRQLPVSRMKIDKSFISEIAGGGAPLLASIIALGRGLGLRIVAEGVETREQLDFLTSGGCEEVQGYLLSRPVPAEHVVTLLYSTRLHVDVPESRLTTSALPALMARLAEGSPDVVEVIRSTLRELSELSGMDSVFMTSIRQGRQLISIAYNRSGAMNIEEGRSTAWPETLCRRMIESDTLHTSAVRVRHGDLGAVRDLGIESYVTVPVEDSRGQVIGTLCAAGVAPRTLDESVLSVMRLVASALSEHLAVLSTHPG